jgi:hypothetical protein
VGLLGIPTVLFLLRHNLILDLVIGRLMLEIVVSSMAMVSRFWRWSLMSPSASTPVRAAAPGRSGWGSSPWSTRLEMRPPTQILLPPLY